MSNFLSFVAIFLLLALARPGFAQVAPAHKRAPELGLPIGAMTPGKWDAITDVPGIKVGQTTLIQGDSVCTGVTAILPHDGNIFQQKVPAAIFVGNGFGKLAVLAATTTRGRNGHTAESLPMDKVLPILRQYNRIK